MASRNPTNWMWDRACDLMEQAERMHRQFFQLAASSQARAIWEPPADVFEDEREFLVVLALPGVAPECVQIALEAGVLVVRAERRIPFAGSGRRVRRLEIPYGYFERRIQLPEARLESITREISNGCLILRLRRQEGAGRL